MFKIIFSSGLLLFTACCGSKGANQAAAGYLPGSLPKDSVPACVRKLIDDGRSEIPPNVPVQVDEYLYRAKKVFLFTAPCCDQFNVLYDENCKRICAPTGGIMGRGDMACNDFAEKARLVKTIWKNTSSKNQ